jgi:Xaa-Pro aminopeptidase
VSCGIVAIMARYRMLFGALAAAAIPGAAGAAPNTATSGERRVGPEVEAEIPARVYRARREQLIDRLGGCTAAIKSRATDEAPDPYFYYLTGVEEPDAVLVLSPRARVSRQSLLFPPRDPGEEQWTGFKEPISPRLRSKYGVDGVSTTRGWINRFVGAGLRRSPCYAHLRFPDDKEDVPAKDLGVLVRGHEARTIMRWTELERMRAIKDAEELKRLEKAIAITIEGHAAAARTMAPGIIERQVSAAIRSAYFAAGATGLAFPSIVGSGPNGAVLHWVKNNRAVADGDLVLIDIGASFGHYAADITRTYPVSGSFTPEQRRLYESVLRVQNLVISRVRPGISLDELNKIAVDELLAAGHEMPHGVGHFVGLEVHDVGDRGGPLEPGMVITVEPGIYIRGKLGIRIEDMVRVTGRGGELMTGALPRKPAAVEAWMKQVRAAGK